MSCLRAALSQSDISRGVYTKTEHTAESKVIMDVRILLTALVTLVLVAVCHATIDPDQAVQIVGELDAHHSISRNSSPTAVPNSTLPVAVS